MGDWKKKRFGDFVKGTRGVSYKPSDLEESKTNRSIFLLRSNNIQDSKLDLSDVQIVNERCVKQSQILSTGDVVVCMSNGSKRLVGKSCVYNLTESGYCVGAFCSSFSAENGIDSNYVFQLFQSDDYQRQVDISLAGSAINNLKNSTIEDFEFLVPESLEEQSTIATILSTVDVAIEKTEQLIAKYERIKTGLMQDLLTRGIDEQGNIRSEETHEFKDSPLGRIPVEWEIVNVNSLCKEIVVGIVIRPTQYYVESGFPLLRSFNVKEGRISNENLVYISKEDNNHLSKSRLRLGDVVSVRTGYPGTTAVVEEDFVNSNCIDLVISRPKEKLYSYFLSYWINSEIGKKQILNHQKGVAQQHFNVGEMKELLIVDISLAEQRNIVQRLSSIENLIYRFQLELSKLSATKTALMQDLLTGKVRVDRLLEATT